jgi:hypothetical protein
MKACMVCGDAFQPARPLQRVCTLVCARKVPIVARKKERAESRRVRARLEELRPLSYWVKQAQTAFNAWVRERDKDRPCVSCQCPTAKQWHAGHYLSTGARPELRFDEQNVHKQCSQCNEYLSGNLVPYRDELIRREGRLTLRRLEGPQEPKRYRADDLKAIRDEYRGRLKAMKGGER